MGVTRMLFALPGREDAVLPETCCWWRRRGWDFLKNKVRLHCPTVSCVSLRLSAFLEAFTSPRFPRLTQKDHQDKASESRLKTR